MRRAVASLPPPLLTDVRAPSEDCDEEREVAQAWSALSAAIASAADQRSALDAFLAVFLLRCSAWAPVEPGMLERPAPARPRGCNAGHPLALLQALAQAVEQAASELACGALERQLPLCLCHIVCRAHAHVLRRSELKHRGQEALALHAVHVRVFEAFRVVVRSRHNRAQLLNLHAFGSLARCLACLAARLAQQQGDGATLEPSLNAATTFLTVVSAVSALCAALEAELRVIGRPLRLASMSDVCLPSADTYARARRDRAPPSSAALIGTFAAGTVEVLVRLVIGMRRTRLSSPVSSDIPLEAPTLRCLAALLLEGPASGIAAFRDAGGLEMLLDGVGQPPPDFAHARSELRAQLAVLEVCGAAVSADRESLRRAVSVGMFSRLASLLRWAGSAFASELGTELPRIAGPVSNDHMTLVFDTMHTLCDGVSDEAGSRRTLAERTLLAVASAAFAHSEASHWPDLTDHALQFLESLLSASPLAVATLRSAGADVALFGSAVFFWKPVDQEISSASILAARRMLRARAMSLLRAIAVAPAWSYGGVRVDLGIEPELTALMRALDACCSSGDADGCAALADVLCQLATAAPERFALASVSMGAPVSLANVILQLHARHDAASDAAVSARTAALLAFEALTTCSATVRAYHAGNEAVSEMLVTMLLTRHDPHAERWALRQLQCIAQEAPAVPRRSCEPAAGAEAACKSPLYRALLQSLSRARQDRAELLPPLLALLQASALSGPEERLVLATERAHVILVELMSGDGGPSLTLRTCVLHGAATLSTLLSGCASARDKFARDPGYDAFAAALEHNADALTPSLFRQLCLLICDLPGDPGESAALDTAPAHSFRHAGVLFVFMRCLRRSEPDLQLAGLRWLAAGLRSSSAAQCCAAEAALPRLLLDWYGGLSSAGIADDGSCLATLRAALTDALAVCLAVTAADIRAAFALLRRKDAPHRRQLLGALCAAAFAARDEPRAFFALPGGDESGIHLVLPLRWLPGRPVTLFLWLRVDELTDVETALLSLRGSCGAGILISLSSTYVCATVCTAGAAYAAQSQVRMTHAIQPRRWQSVAVVLGSGGLGVFGGERARLYIDGAEVATARLRLPRVLSSTPLQLSAIGAAPTLDGSPVLPPFAGQVASPHIFDDALRVSTVAALHARGPEFQLELTANASTSNVDSLQDAAERCVVAFSAAASSRTLATAGAGSTICYNISPVMSPAIGEEARSGTAPAAMVGASTAVFVFRGVCDAFRALGGISSVLPLLDDADDDFVASALRLTAEVAMVPTLDTALLTHALRRRGSRIPLSRSVFDSALHLESTSKESGLPGYSLVYDVAFWALYGSDDACIAQATFLSTATPAALLAHRQTASPLQIADAIADLRPKCTPLLRRAWLSAATTQMSGAAVAITPADDALALAALVTGSPESAVDAARALTCFLSSQQPSRKAHAVAFAETGGCLLSLFAVHKSAAEAQPAALRLLTALLAALPDPSRACDTPGLFGVLRHSFMSSAPSLDLMSALLGFACLNPNLQLEEHGRSGAPPPEIAAPPVVVHAAVIGTVLQLVRSCSDQKLRLTTLVTVTEWVERSVVNAGVLVSHHGWQSWLLQLLLSPELLPAQQHGESLPSGLLPQTEERMLVRRLFGALQAHCLLRFGGPGGGAELDRTATFAKLQGTYTLPGEAAAGARYGDAAHMTLCESLADALELALAPGTRWGPSVADNLSALLFLVDELLPFAASLLPDDAGTVCTSPETPTAAGVWRLSSAACRALVKMWPSLEAAAVTSQAQVAATDAGALTSLSLRQRALTLLSWTGGDSPGTAAEHARAACDQAGRLTLRLCMLYAREADAGAARTHLDLLMPSLELACADKARFGLFCTALSTTTNSGDPERSAVIRNLLLAAAVAGKYLPAPASVASSQASLDLNDSTAEALSKTITEQLLPELRSSAIEAETATVRSAVVRRQDAVTALREELANRSASDSAAATLTLDAVRAAASALNQSARARRSAAHAALDEYSAAQERRLRHALRSASGERGVWAPAVQPAAHWKVDKTEDSKRRRLRLRRDYRHGTYAGSVAAPLKPVVHAEQQQADAARMAAMAGAVCLPGHAQESMLSIAEGTVTSAEASTPLDAEEAPPQAFVERDADILQNTPGSAAGDELMWTTPATLVTVKRAVKGRLDIHRKHVHFEADPDSPADAVDDASQARHQRRDTRMHWRWPVSRLVAVHCQRYLLQSRALELFLDDRASAFLALPNRTAAVRAAAAIIRVRPGLPLLDKRRKAEAAARAAERWRRREMSNFDYIMTLNTLAGRSYNDLAQYPVFPWVLADYVSEKLDLAAPGTLRDLTLPVGALNPARRAALVERYAALAAENNADMPPFHHGSHYSTPGGVLHWLVRLQPYTALHRALQGGHFDHGDRLFHSVPAAWSGAWSNAADVRELTPEFFCAPEFLLNGEAHDLGQRQDGQRVSHVALPPWAHGDPAAFVRANAAALECEAVSVMLHSWVDLVFGCAQRGPAAVEKFNVFYHLTYEGAVDLERVADERSRAALADQIALFGQTPAQLFSRRHVQRDAVLWPPAALCAVAHGAAVLQPLTLLTDVTALPAERAALLATGQPVVFISASSDGRVMAVCDDGSLTSHRLVRPSPAAGAFTFSAALEAGYMLGYDGTSTSAGSDSATWRGPSLPPFAASVAVSPACFTTLADARLLVSAPHWDARLRVLRLAGGDDVRILQSLHAHTDVVTCVASSFGPAGSFCVTGSRDTTLCVWQLAAVSLPAALSSFIGAAGPVAGAAITSATAPMRVAPLFVLPGHDAAVSCVACSEELDMIASASAGDSTIMIHALRSGRYMRSLNLPADVAPAQLLISEACGSLIVLLQPDPSSASLSSTLRAFNCNGLALGVAVADELLAAVTLTLDCRSVLTGGERGTIVMRNASSLHELARWSGTGASLTALCAVADDAALAGTRDGRLQLWGPVLGADSPRYTRA